MELTTLERIMLLNSLPKEGDITSLKIVRKLREDLSFSEEEHAKLQFKQLPTGGTSWIEIEPKDIQIGEKAADIIKGALKLLNAEKKLTEDHMSVYEKFVGE